MCELSGLSLNQLSCKNKNEIRRIEAKRFTNSSKLFVGNLPQAATRIKISELFNPFGRLGEIFHNEEKKFAFVSLDYKENAENAIQKLDNTNWMGSSLAVRFANIRHALKVRNLSPFVTNEWLEVAFSTFGEIDKTIIATDESGKPTGEGIVEFSKKSQSQEALKRCKDKLFFLTTTPRPVIVEPLVSMIDGDGYKERELFRNKSFYKERRIGPRFAVPGTVQHIKGERWRKLYMEYDKKIEAVNKELLEGEKNLLEEIEASQKEYEAEMLKRLQFKDQNKHW